MNFRVLSYYFLPNCIFIFVGRLSTSPGCGSPILSSGIDGNATSMLPTPHSPSPLLQGNKVSFTVFSLKKTVSDFEFLFSGNYPFCFPSY